MEHPTLLSIKIDELLEFIDKNSSLTTSKKSWAINPNKKKSEFRNYSKNPRQKTVENFYKLQHEKMSYDLVMKKRKKYLAFNQCILNVWDMLQFLDSVIDESDPDTDLSQMEHALQTAEAARKMYPSEEFDWLHVTAFIHDLGKVLATSSKKYNFAMNEPQWCVVGDIFPVGCQFSQKCIFYEYFKNNPDYNNNKYNTKYGIYSKNIGLENIIMSWGHDEYMYNIAKNQSLLPAKALYILRYHSFYPWHTRGDYYYLCNKKDIDIGLKWVKIFNSFDLYSKSDECPSLETVADYYKKKIAKYFPNPVRW